YRLPFIQQSQINSQIGFNFASGLRSILRQDPDVIMVGEIRDAETAQLAVQAALTGHLVFSTLHTNDAASSITRLADLGIERFLISSTLVGAMAQRLVRKVCPHCTQEHYLTPQEAAALRLALPQGKRARVKVGGGCFECRGTGYYERTGVFEILPVDERIQELVVADADHPRIKRAAVEGGMRTLRQSALQKLAAGVTTFEEVIRVTTV
ncbi:MAG: ATPase, T2SS/T4P/T4SS family, partial [Thermoanaerobaculia bacterium]|nr:ATPase, T2SS/T4P/T4SS family [Thermoanaerobaculia bacterium]